MDPTHLGSYTTSYTTSQYQTSAQPASYTSSTAPTHYTATYEISTAPAGYSYTQDIRGGQESASLKRSQVISAEGGATGGLAYSTYEASPLNYTSTTTVPGITTYSYEHRGGDELKKSSYAVTTPTSYTATTGGYTAATQPASYTVSSTVPTSYTATYQVGGSLAPASYTSTTATTGGYHPEVERVLKSYAGTSEIGVSHHTTATDPYNVWTQVNSTQPAQSYTTGTAYSHINQPSSYASYTTPSASYTAQPTYSSTVNYTTPQSYTNTSVTQTTAPTSYTTDNQARYGTPERKRDDTGLNIVVQRVQNDKEHRSVQSVPNRPVQSELRKSILSPYRNTMYPEFELVEDLPDRTHLIESINTFLQKSPAKESLLVSPSRVSIKRQSMLSPAQIEVQSLIKVKYEDGSIYEGEGLYGKRHGKGRLSFADGRILEGQFRDGKAEGNAVIYYKNGKLNYEGGIDNNLYQGQGVLQCETPIPFQGSFDPNNFGNIGNSWTKYEGEFRAGKKNGRGTLHLSNGERFIGEFRDDKVDGRGEFHSRDGRVVQGYWENNKLVRTQ